MNVLIVEDEAVARTMLESLLPLWGYEVISVRDGLEAWERMQQPDAPRLTIVDWQMPGLDGLELTRRLRAQTKTPYVHVLMLTSRDSTADLIAGMEAGADDYLPKPFDPHELRVRLDAARRAVTAQDQVSRLASELERKNARLALLTDTAHRFVDDVSHEFRTPLTVIKEFTSIVSDGLAGPVTDTQTEYLQLVTNAVNDLAQMVDDLLDSSKLKAGTLRIDRCDHAVADLLAGARVLVDAKARSRGITIVEDAGAPGLRVTADREKVVRVLVNLLVNAIKFGPENSTITLRATAGPDDDIRVSVADEGAGMTPEELQRIFERFTQVGTACETTKGGFGLGLSIARELVWLNLGTIHVESTPGNGSTFSFTLPNAHIPTVVTHYLRRIAELPDPPARFAVLRVASNEASIDDLRALLASCCYPTDLVLIAADRSSVLVTGLSDAPGRWVHRLRERAGAPAFEVTTVGVFEFPNDVRAAERTLREALDGSCAHVA